MAEQLPAVKTQAAGEQPLPSAVAVPPLVTHENWESFPCFRETFLVYFPEPHCNRSLRGVGDLLFSMVLEYWQHWPSHPEGWIPTLLRAVLADLRHLEGLLASLGKESLEVSSREARLGRLAVEASAEIRTVADRLESELGPRPAEGPF